jgi:hypothetical protein
MIGQLTVRRPELASAQSVREVCGEQELAAAGDNARLAPLRILSSRKFCTSKFHGHVFRISQVRNLRGIKSRSQARPAEGLERRFDGTLLERPSSDRVMRQSGDENDRVFRRRRVGSRCGSGPDVPGAAILRVRHRVALTQPDAVNF